ncbi:MAG: hypothetical protein HQ572_00165 [Candidatus Omnitrophica bacterium]|nr:hypothetical protein [Candidatus Omnitrophota bacterium]
MSTLLNQIYVLLFKRPKIIAIVFGIVGLVLFVIYSLAFNDYAATAQIVVVMELGPSEGASTILEQKTQTIAASLKKPEFIEYIIESLNLTDRKYDYVASKIAVKPIKGSDIIEIRAKADKPHLAAQMANTLSKVAIEQSTEDFVEANKFAADMLVNKAKEMRTELASVVTEVRALEKTADAANLQKEYSIVKDRLDSLQESLAGIVSSRQEMQAAYSSMQSQLESGVKPEDITEIKNDDSYIELESENFMVKSHIDEMLRKYNPAHPEIVASKEKLKASEDLMKARAQAVLKEAENNYNIFKVREEKIQQMLQEENDKLVDLEGQLDKYNLALRELKEKETVYNAFINNIEEKLKSSTLQPDLQLLREAYIPSRKDRPSIAYLILASIFFTFLIVGIYNRPEIKVDFKPSGKEDRETPKARDNKGIYIERVKEDDK